MPVTPVEAHGACVLPSGKVPLQSRHAIRFHDMALSAPARWQVLPERERAANRTLSPDICGEVVTDTGKPACGLDLSGRGPPAE